MARPSGLKEADKEQIRKLALKGFTDKEIADFFYIPERTFEDWKKQNSDFLQSLKNWKIEADVLVEKSLYQRALGYEYDEVSYEKVKPGGLGIGFEKGEVAEIKHVECYKTKITTKKVIPDVTAQIFWLKNRQPQNWREKHELDLPSDLIAGMKSLVNYVKNADRSENLKAGKRDTRGLAKITAN